LELGVEEALERIVGAKLAMRRASSDTGLSG
jgi:hypothetical protein